MDSNQMDEQVVEKQNFCKTIVYFLLYLPVKIIKWILSWSWKTWLKIVVIGFFALGVFIISVIFREQVLVWIIFILDWIEKAGYKGMLVMVILYAIATVLFIPGLILTLAAGFLWKYWGIPIISVGSTIGATLAFFLGRTLGRSIIEEQTKQYKQFKAIDDAVRAEGWKIILLLRLTPLIPFNFLNYALAITNIDWFVYILCSWIGMLPGTALYVYIGLSAGSLADIIQGKTSRGEWWVQLIIFGSTGFFVLVGFIFIGFVSRKYVKKYIKDNSTVEETIATQNNEENNVEKESENLIAKEDEIENI